MIIYIDFDKTICNEHLKTIHSTTPNKPLINKINELYDNGHKIIIYTCRFNNNICDEKDRQLMIEWLTLHNVKYHGFEKNKPYYDLLIDDRAINPLINIDHINNIK